MKESGDASGFVLLADAAPAIVQEIRYYSTFNFVGERIDGYEEPCALLTKEAAQAIRTASEELFAQGCLLKVYDAYRPACAVAHFMRWGENAQDARMKPYFYPDLEKSELIPNGYISAQSSHSRGSAVDVTLVSAFTGRDLDMGGTFDLFDERSHGDYRGVTDEQYANRMLLQNVMVQSGFRPYPFEWWHFTLIDEPYPDTEFTFPVSSASVKTAKR